MRMTAKRGALLGTLIVLLGGAALAWADLAHADSDYGRWP